ncbi:MAG TPA: ACT domain-containing protein [Acidiferrobacterales bacterium]
MTHWYMLTVVGADRPGIVAALAAALYRGGCNLGEASMVRLGGNFTVMLMVESPGSADAVQRLVQTAADGFALRVHVDPIEARLHAHTEPNVQVAVHGADRAGIVAEVTQALADAGFHILDLNSDVGGTRERPIYVMLLEGHVAGGAAVLEPALAPLRSTGIEVRVSPIDTLVG